MLFKLTTDTSRLVKTANYNKKFSEITENTWS